MNTTTRRRRLASALCGGKSGLFDSTDLLDHQRARVRCSSCPVMRECLDDAIAQSRGPRSVPDGTWGGLLWRNGHILTGAKRRGIT